MILGRSSTSSRRWLLLLVGLSCAWALASTFAKPALADETVDACGSDPTGVFTGVSAFGINDSQSCPGGSMAISTPGNTVRYGSRAYWEATAPSGLSVDGAQVSSMSVNGINNGGQYGGGFFWGPNNSEGAGATPGETSAVFRFAPSSSFGFQIVCGDSSNCTTSGSNFQVGAIQLSVAESSPPWVTAGGLWNATGWVRGTWPINAASDSASGVCDLDIGFVAYPNPLRTTYPTNPTTWHQCNGAASGVSTTLNTALMPNGPQHLYVLANDAAQLESQPSEVIDLDNEVPTVSLSLGLLPRSRPPGRKR